MEVAQAARPHRSTQPEMGIADMLHHIRAAARTIQAEARRQWPGDANAVTRRLSRLLSLAMRQQSALDIAVILGSAAELRYFPDDAALERCTRMVESHGGKAMRAVVWAVRHRRVRAGVTITRRFIVDAVD
ncbi:hypothetical protein [Cupriavidus sp. L7L]|uniref:hypothetical protein n=1 Tax=Cupriavidus sp. L7L TaxID=2546443 RepID=UPI001056678E|nr:hypothetical protein [Cupriavidus sp. L7L]TDF66784.1 hypothetical protein E1J61_05730 [Cupriavidus sp. L7L]